MARSVKKTALSASLIEPLLEAIAKDRLGFDTLETQRIGAFDFQEVAVWGVKAALTDAFNLGVEFGAAGGSKLKPNPRRRATRY